MTTPRRAMTLARKRRIHARCGGLCQGRGCAAPVPVSGLGVVYDHRLQLYMDSPDEDDAVDVLCASCVKAKDAADASRRGKVRRVQKKLIVGAPRKPSRIRSRGFSKEHRPFPQSRGFR